MSLYSQRGVSAQKEDVHKATEKLDKGLYPYAFCKIYEDFLTGDKNWVNLMHADGAGTKSILAYLYWKDTGDISVWRGIAQDAIVMNLDDLLCVGIYDNLLFSSTIDRNKSVIPADVLAEIINASQTFFDDMKRFDVHIEFLGGETADVGDLVRTIAVNGTMTARWKKEKIITNEKISDGDVIVGFASSGQANYETAYNSGIGSNGLTSARHDVLNKAYAENFPETFEPLLNNEVVYIGSKKLTDTITFDYRNKPVTTSVGALLLSPTRTYAPLVKQLLSDHFEEVHGMIHCSGGGQTKCMKYLHKPFKIIKDNLFAPPEIFKLIQQSSGADQREMYQVFNMGHRLEVFTDKASAAGIIELAGSFDIEAQVIGRVEAHSKKELIIDLGSQQISYLS